MLFKLLTACFSQIMSYYFDTPAQLSQEPFVCLTVFFLSHWKGSSNPQKSIKVSSIFLLCSKKQELFSVTFKKGSLETCYNFWNSFWFTAYIYPRCNFSPNLSIGKVSDDDILEPVDQKSHFSVLSQQRAISFVFTLHCSMYW